MSTTPFDIVAGPATVYIHTTAGTAAPAVNASAGTITGDGWTALGLTEGGVKAKHTQSITQLMADQRSGPVKAIRAAEGLEISFALAELTLENFGLALNNATVSTSTGPARKILGLYQGLDVAQFALLVIGPSPYMDANSQYWVPVVVQTDSPEVDFVKDNKAVLQTTWTAIEDPNAASEDLRFGTLIAQTS